MRPKKRERQHQSSRMYLRRKDHRECIMNDVYHNAIWLKKTKSDGTVQDELVWLKYPKRHFLYIPKYGNLQNTVLGYFDIDRQFGFGTSFGYAYQSFVANLEEYVCLLRSYTLYISKDGIVYKHANITRQRTNMGRFGRDAIVTWNHSETTLSYTVIDILDFDTDDFHIVEVDRSFQTVSMNRNPAYICDTEDGCIVGYIPNGVFYELTRQGIRRLNDVALEMHDVLNGSEHLGTRNGNFCCFCRIEHWRDSIREPFKFEFCIYWTNDKTTWTKDIVLTFDSWDSVNYSDMVCVRKGVWTYFYCRWDNEIRLFKTTTGGYYSEVELPSSLMFRTIRSGGEGVADCGFDVFQLKLKKNAVSSGDYQVDADSIDFSAIKQGIGYTYFKDGEITEEVECFSFWMKDSSNKYFLAWMDNNEFQSSEDNVLFQCRAYQTPSGTTYADKVIEGDYVLKKGDTDVRI